MKRRLEKIEKATVFKDTPTFKQFLIDFGNAVRNNPSLVDELRSIGLGSKPRQQQHDESGDAGF